MKYNNITALGGKAVSEICFGALTIGPLQAKMDIDDGAAVILRALELGINHIDTAQIYGTYPHIRRAFELYGRNDAVISTKTFAYTRESAKAAHEEAVKSLGRDFIDIFLLHEQESIHTLRGHAEALDYLFEQKSAGRIGAVGISTHNISGVTGAVERGGIDVIHPMFNMAGLGIADGLGESAVAAMSAALAEAHAKGIFIYAMKALGGGNLISDAAHCFDFVRSRPFIDSVAIGIQDIREVEDNVFFFENGYFPERYHEWNRTKKRRLLVDTWCTGCGECIPHCKQNALYKSGNRTEVDTDKCVLCGYCGAYCGNFCIKVI